MSLVGLDFIGDDDVSNELGIASKPAAEHGKALTSRDSSSIYTGVTGKLSLEPSERGYRQVWGESFVEQHKQDYRSHYQG